MSRDYLPWFERRQAVRMTDKTVTFMSRSDVEDFDPPRGAVLFSLADDETLPEMADKIRHQIDGVVSDTNSIRMALSSTSQRLKPIRPYTSCSTEITLCSRLSVRAIFLPENTTRPRSSIKSCLFYVDTALTLITRSGGFFVSEHKTGNM